MRFAAFRTHGVYWRRKRREFAFTARKAGRKLAATIDDLGLTHEALYRTLARMEHDGEITRAGMMLKIKRLM